MTRTTHRTALISLLLLAGCASASIPPRIAPAGRSGVPPRSAIAPAIDHHQHLMGPTAVPSAAPPLPVIELPPALERVLVERNRIMGTEDLGDLYVEDPQILDLESGRWASGTAAVQDMVDAYTTDSHFVPNRYTVGDSVAYVAGVGRAGDPPVDDMNFMLALEKDGSGEWRIATEYATLLPPRPYAEPVTADQLIQNLDDAGIGRAVVLSVAYWFGSPGSTRPGDEYGNVRAENDWVAEQVALYPDRLVGFCGVSPLRAYAVEEVRRCANDLHMKGLKLHFGSSDVEILDPGHRAKVSQVFEVANELGLAIVVHSRGPGEYGREHAEALIDLIATAAPDVPVQIAHLWGGANLSEPALAAFADAVSAGDPGTQNLYFDLTEVERAAGGSRETMQMIAERIRQIGLERVLYGSDMATGGSPPPVLAWARLRRSLPLTDAELRVIADNVAPYMR